MMQFSKWKIGAVALVCMLLPGSVHAQIVKNERLLSFEEKQVPAFVTTAAGSQLGISDEHYRDGDHSLSWTFEPGAALSIKKDLKFEKKDPTGKDTYLSAFIVWVYNEQAQDKQIRFEFLKDGKVCTSFPFGINFTGWRGAWVCYERDMQGTPEEGMDEIRIVAPDVKGKLFFDHLITASKVDARQQTADLQVPFVNKGTTNHWLVIYEHSLWKPDIPLTDVTEAQKQDIRIMEKRFATCSTRLPHFRTRRCSPSVRSMIFIGLPTRTARWQDVLSISYVTPRHTNVWYPIGTKICSPDWG